MAPTRRAFAAGVVLACAGAFLAGCEEKSTSTPSGGTTGAPAGGTGGAAAAKKYTVGVSLLTKTHPFYKDLEAGLREEAAKRNVELLVQAAEFDTSVQTSQIENFVTQKVDAIVMCPVDSQTMGGAVKRANDAKLPVFTADIRSKQGDIVCHIASDNVQGGRLIGEYLAKAVNGKGSVAIIDHPEASSVQERVRGFEEALSKFPDLKIVAKQPGGGVRDKAMTTTENILQAHPEITAIFGINDNSALGAIAALQARGKKDVLVVGFDADAEGQKAIRAGTLLADAVQYPKKIGTVTIETVVKHLQGEKVPKEIPIETGTLDKAGLEKQ